MSAEPILMAILGGTGYFFGTIRWLGGVVLLEDLRITQGFTESWMACSRYYPRPNGYFSSAKAYYGTVLDWWMRSIKK